VATGSDRAQHIGGVTAAHPGAARAHAGLLVFGRVDAEKTDLDTGDDKAVAVDYPRRPDDHRTLLLGKPYARGDRPGEQHPHHSKARAPRHQAIPCCLCSSLRTRREAFH
jgi:hypothetical protein